MLNVIERVANKRYTRLCAQMPEAQSAANVAQWLKHLKSVHRLRPHVLYFIEHLESAYLIVL